MEISSTTQPEGPFYNQTTASVIPQAENTQISFTQQPHIGQQPYRSATTIGQQPVMVQQPV